MIEKWKRALDENMKVRAIFMTLSKTFDLLILKDMVLNKLRSILQVVFIGEKLVIVIVHVLK